jgi:hypothetical protein
MKKLAVIVLVGLLALISQINTAKVTECEGEHGRFDRYYCAKIKNYLLNLIF